MPIFAVEYTYTDDIPTRDEHRRAHRAYLGGLVDVGILLCSGPYADTSPDGALIVLRAESAEEVGALLERDPFRLEGLVAERTVTRWEPVLGPWASA